jgi:hypothetical protein
MRASCREEELLVGKVFSQSVTDLALDEIENTDLHLFQEALLVFLSEGVGVNKLTCTGETDGTTIFLILCRCWWTPRLCMSDILEIW